MSEQHIARLCELARRTCDAPVELAAPPLAHATGTLVGLRCVQTILIGKIHRSRSLHEREVHAYREWTPQLGLAVPRLLAADSDLPGIVVTTVPGTPLDELALDPITERAAHHQAGVLLRQLHRIPVTASATELTVYLADRAEHWIIQTADHLSPRGKRLLREHMHRLAALPAPRVAACHLDFQPRNLLWHTDGRIRLIDFEHSRIDLAARDLTRLATRYWSHRPDLKTAFLTGYGPLSSNDQAVLNHATALEAVTSIAHGLRNNGEEFIRHGRALLDGLPWP
ncbi:phosphotransferase family protein [Haloactinomyces albus]|uniref:Aminoglycoside/choline kinase family phosphotransferase n=1 Tax=Haloactinomyces albus TaxID=1352928 RepID=A0AAE4CNG3_9ACTN|nr:aminoglycoside phosphotransferase family protein [Haloactinomyces albus]MDR7303879.1 aminoglycoside/choline kinase family phosphotransferase [Haloactinomyces albus]